MNKPHSQFGRYLTIWLAAVGCYFAIVMAVNRQVDPFNELGRNTTGVYFSVERQTKEQILDFPHDAIIIGASKFARIDPTTLHCHTFYNSAFDAALPEEIYYYLKRYLTDERLVVIGLDFEFFNERQFAVKKMDEWPRHSFGQLEYLVNFNTFKSSLVALYKSHKKEPPLIAANGQRITRKKDTGPAEGEVWRIGPGVAHTKHDFKDDLETISNHFLRRFLFSQERMEYLRKIKALLASKQIPCIVIINPYNHNVLDLIKSKGLEGTFNQWRKGVKEIFPDAYDLSVGKYSYNDDYFPDTDPYHYLPIVGTKVINSVVRCPN